MWFGRGFGRGLAERFSGGFGVRLRGSFGKRWIKGFGWGREYLEGVYVPSLEGVKSLVSLRDNESGEIFDILGPLSERIRLKELGIREGKKVTKLREAPFEGSIEVDVDGVKLTLRRDIASYVLVKEEK